MASRFLLVGAFLLVASRSLGEAPEVRRVEPPNWWEGHSHNPVRVLVTGTNLQELSVRSQGGLLISNVSAHSAGTHLFCDVFIPPGTLPGPRQLKFTGPHGSVTADFSVLAAPDRASRFAGFRPDDVIYLIMPDRFANGDHSNDNPATSPGLHNRSKPRDYHGGDLQGIINQLPYLRDLGVTALWLTPWYDNVNHPNTKEKYTRENQRSPAGVPSTDYHGYGAVDFYGVEEHFGTLAKLQELVAVAQAQGFKVVQDQVANHTGPYHPWVKAPPTPTWFNGSEAAHLENTWDTWTLAQRHPPADKLKSTLEGWFINILPDLNQNDPETATYLIQNSLWWIGMTGVDAVRQDTLPYVPRSYWAKWTAALKREFPNLTILGEVLDSRPDLVAFFQGGRPQFDGIDTGVETLFDFPLHYAIREVFVQGQPMTRLAGLLAADTNYVNPRVLVTLLGLHDTERFLGARGATLARLQQAYSFLLTTRGTPLIYYGDEIGMTGGGDPDNRRDFPGGWAEDAQNALQAGTRTASQAELHTHVRTLLHLRREIEPLRRGDLNILHAGDDTLAYSRVVTGAGVVVALNRSDRSQPLSLQLPGSMAQHARLHNRFGLEGTVLVRNGRIDLAVPAQSVLILSSAPATVAAK
jgi:glycosidase